MVHITPKIKRNALIIFTGFFVAYVRRAIQYGLYSWDSIGQLISWWLIHYIAVAILMGISVACISSTEKFFFGEEKGADKRLSSDEAIVYISIVILVLTVAIFFTAQWTPTEDHEGDISFLVENT